ncbi:uncharacterized protein DKFZp434B061-like [Numida meleagris]|uniref:uncharacterized protein DKFZp434B061-like n=1 Tax=Numida meleagris TaxID=8996 RepID=UPI000B3E19F4|nr:uncharacterized protein DKFZp434B061-like [Numida meleagris]
MPSPRLSRTALPSGKTEQADRGQKTSLTPRKRVKTTCNTNRWEKAARPPRALTLQDGTQHGELRDAPLGHPGGHRTAAGPGTWQQPPPTPVPARPRSAPRAAPSAGSSSAPLLRPPRARSPPAPGSGCARRPKGTATAEARGPRRSPGPAGGGPPARAAAGGGKRGARPGRRPPTARGGCGGSFRSAAARCARPCACAPPRPQPHLAARCARGRREARGGRGPSPQPPPRAAPGGALDPRIAGYPPRALTCDVRSAVEARQSGAASFRQSPPCWTARGQALPAHVAGRRHKTLEVRSELGRVDVPPSAWTEGTALLGETRRILWKETTNSGVVQRALPKHQHPPPHSSLPKASSPGLLSKTMLTEQFQQVFDKYKLCLNCNVCRAACFSNDC